MDYREPHDGDEAEALGHGAEMARPSYNWEALLRRILGPSFSFRVTDLKVSATKPGCYLFGIVPPGWAEQPLRARGFEIKWRKAK